ncbi:hypothetical protein [Ligilactobacillus apodemi]|uniref:hypothetical protein n=1 Tax=Ligilactobacillus apodemi TaxID=307126 RepID=UPI00214BCFDA|nr:hypothetical protein [Ligilactobacillus apodemi]MCR1900861.1 hypothetical protein [Ligilactobacillus apodemi]
MLSQADETIAAWRATERTLAVIVDINGNKYTATDINSLKYDAGAYTGETFAIGSTYSNSVQIEFSHLVEGLNLGDEVQVSIGVKVSDNYVYEPLGVFIISSEIKMDRNNNLTTISASDRFCGLEGIYSSKLTYPAKVLDVISEICAQSGVKANTDDLARLPLQADLSTPITGQSYRKALGWISQLYAGYALFDRQGLFTIRTIAAPNYELDPSQYEQGGLTKNEALYKIGGIQCQVTTKTTTRDEQTQETTVTLQVGSTSGAQIKLENNVMTQERLDYIWEKLKDISFYPFSLNWFGNPAIEAGDWLRLYDKKGNEFVVPNNGYILEFNGGLSAVSKADQASGSAQTISWSGSVMQTIKELQHRNALDGTVIFPANVSEPPENAHFNDVWFKKNGNDTELWIFERQDDGTGEWKRNDIANDEVKKQILEQQADLEEVRGKADQAYTSAKSAHSTADLIYASVMDMQTNLSTQLDDIDTRAQLGLQNALDNVTRLEKNYNDFEKAVNGRFDSSASESAKMIAEVSASTEELSNKAKQQQKAITDLITSVDGVKGQYATLDGRVTQFNAGIDGLNAQLRDAKGQLVAIKVTADGTATNLSNAQGDIASLKTRANGLEQQLLSKVGSDVFESFKSSTAQELKEKLTATDLNGYVKTAELTRTADGLHASITAVDGKLNSLSFGERNLLKQSQLSAKFPHDAWYETFGGVTWNNDTVELNVGNKDCVQIEQRLYNIEPNTDYVFSFDLNYADGQHLDKQGFIFWEFKDRDCKQTTSVYKDNWDIANMSNFPNTPGRADKKLVIHTQPDTHAIIFMVRSLKGATAPFRISKVKFEKGNVVTDYTKAPEDIAKQLSKVDDTLKSQSVDLKVLKDGMQLRINEISSVNDRFNSLMIGGTNLLDRTSSEAISNDAPTTGWIEGAVYNTTQPLNEKQYILSFEARGDVNGQRIGTFIWHGGLGGRNISKKSMTSLGETFNAVDGQTFVTLTNQWKRYWVLYDVDSDNTKKTAVVSRRWVDSKPSGKVYIRKVKLEAGNKATDWSPAPEDTVNQLLNVGNTLKTYQTELNVLKDGMTFRTSEIARVNDRIDKLGIQNLIYNSEFSNNAEGWTNIGNNSAGTIFFSNNEWDSWQGSNGLAFRNSSAPTSTLSSQSKRFKVLNWQRISASVQLHVTDTITNSCDAGIEIVFYPDETSGNEIKRVSQTTSRVNNISNGFAKLLYVNDVEVPSNAKFATLRLWTYKVGNVIFNQPMVTFSSSYLPYTQDNKSLGVLSEKYAALDVKVNGINSVVANKADVSYVDQRAGQWQAKLEGLQVGGTNLVQNSGDFQNTNYWSLSDNGVSGASLRLGKHDFWKNNKENLLLITNTSSTKEVTVSSSYFDVKSNTTYTVSFWVFHDANLRDYDVYFLGRKYKSGNNFDIVVQPIAGAKASASSASYVTKTFNSGDSNEGYIRFDNNAVLNNGQNSTLYIADVKVEEGDKATAWSPAPEDNMAAITAVRNELNTAIDLRVQKGELLSQINMQAGHTLIQANKIYLDSESVVFSGKAFIPNAAIASLSADKINGGTINGRTVNVTNLNANNITSGTINGQNLSINLDYGIVNFQKGKLHNFDRTVDIDLDNNYISTADWAGRIMFKGGAIQIVKPSLFDTSSNPYLEISNSVGSGSFHGGVIKGRDNVVITNSANSSAYFLTGSLAQSTFAGLFVGQSDYAGWQPTVLSGADRGVYIVGGRKMPSANSIFDQSRPLITGSPFINVGTDSNGRGSWGIGYISKVITFIYLVRIERQAVEVEM